MKIDYRTSEPIESTVQLDDTIQFGIDMNSMAHLIHVLRNTLYSDKIMAVVREYASNAIDANIEAGKTSMPIQIAIPTQTSPFFRVRDFGFGLTLQQMQTIYTRYGKSTKNSRDDLIGGFGIGAKSGYAYTDMFTIISTTHEAGQNIKRTHSAYLDDTTMGSMSLLAEEVTTDHTGIEINIPVKPNDVQTFTHKISQFVATSNFPIKVVSGALLDYSLGTPNFHTKVDGSRLDIYTKASKYGSTRGYLTNIIMNNVLFPLNIGIIRDYINSTNEWADIKTSMNAFLSSSLICNINVPDNSLAVSLSRESLEYTDKTKRNIVTTIGALIRQLSIELSATLETEKANFVKTSILQRKIVSELNFLKMDTLPYDTHFLDNNKEGAGKKLLFHDMPSSITHYKKARTAIENTQYPFDIEFKSHVTNKIVVWYGEPTNRYMLKDYYGPSLSSHSKFLLVTFANKVEYEQWLTYIHYDEITNDPLTKDMFKIFDLSAAHEKYKVESAGTNRVINKKHQQKVFTFKNALNSATHWARIGSEHYENITIDITEPEIYCLLDRFSPQYKAFPDSNGHSKVNDIARDMGNILKVLGLAEGDIVYIKFSEEEKFIKHGWKSLTQIIDEHIRENIELYANHVTYEQWLIYQDEILANLPSSDAVRIEASKMFKDIIGPGIIGEDEVLKGEYVSSLKRALNYLNIYIYNNIDSTPIDTILRSMRYLSMQLSPETEAALKLAKASYMEYEMSMIRTAIETFAEHFVVAIEAASVNSLAESHLIRLIKENKIQIKWS